MSAFLPGTLSEDPSELSAVSNILFEFGDPIGPEMTFPPLALARLDGVAALFLGDGELPLMAELRLEGIFAEALTSFRATV